MPSEHSGRSVRLAGHSWSLPYSRSTLSVLLLERHTLPVFHFCHWLFLFLFMVSMFLSALGFSPQNSSLRISQTWLHIIITWRALKKSTVEYSSQTNEVSISGGWPCSGIPRRFPAARVEKHWPYSFPRSVVPRAETSVSAGHLLEMQILQPHPKPTESDTGCGAQPSVLSQALQVLVTQARCPRWSHLEP